MQKIYETFLVYGTMLQEGIRETRNISPWILAFSTTLGLEIDYGKLMEDQGMISTTVRIGVWI